MTALKTMSLMVGAIAAWNLETAAQPVTLQLEGPGDTLCIVADYSQDPALPPPGGGAWASLERDTIWQSTDGGITQFDLRFTQVFLARLEGVEGIGWVNLYYSHNDYPNSSNYSYDAEMTFTFEKGGRMLAFTTRGSLFEPYPEAGVIPFGMGGGLEPGAGFTLERYQDGRPETDPLWFRLTGKTDGEAQCPGKKRAWKFQVPETDGSGGCGEMPPWRPGRRH